MNKILNTITLSALQYDVKLKNHNLLIVAQTSKEKYSTIETAFNARNFLHLTGVDTKLSAPEFYEACINGRLKESDFTSKGVTTFMKLEVLNDAMNIDKTAKMIGDYNENRGINLFSHKMMGNIKICMGFVKDKFSKLYVPNTILKADIRDKLFPPTCKIVCILKKKFDEEKYNQITSIGKKVILQELNLPDEITDKFSDEIKPRFGLEVQAKQEKAETAPTLEQENKMLREQNAHMLEVINRTNEILSENPELKKAFVQAKQNHLERKQATKPDIDKKSSITHTTPRKPKR